MIGFIRSFALLIAGAIEIEPTFGFISPGPILLWFFSLVLAGGLATAADRWLAPLRIWMVALICLAPYLALWLAALTFAAVLPALIGSTKEYSFVESGPTVFWIALLLPLSLRLGRQLVAATA